MVGLHAYFGVMRYLQYYEFVCTYLIKIIYVWLNSSYLHCEWRTAEELELGDKRVVQKIKRYKQKKSLQTDYLAQVC